MERVALVTGAASGMGRAIAAELRAAGLAVMVADVDEDAGAAAAKELGAAFVAADLVEADACARSTPLVEGQIADQARTRGIDAAEVEERVLLENAAVKRLLEPVDVARYVAFLASEAAWGITASAATIDLGWTAR